MFKTPVIKSLSAELKIIPRAGMGPCRFLKVIQGTLAGSFVSENESMSREKNRNFPMMPRA